MKELYCVILQTFLAKETVKVLADDIQVDENGVRLYDEDRTVAHFSNEIYRGCYRMSMVVNARREIVSLEEIGAENES